LARVRALLRRVGDRATVANDEVEVGDLRVSRAERRVWRAGGELPLRPREFTLLDFLLRNRGLALSRQQILDGAWDAEFRGNERTVDVHVRALREAIEDDPEHPRLIQTVRGVGYRFEG
jgi:DNA-binding response OmpR family regulator